MVAADLHEAIESMKVCGGILSGGRSRRMGAPKHAIRLDDGRTMIEHVAAVLREVCDAVVVLSGSQTGFEAPHLPDVREDVGPLAGIEALLLSGRAPRFLICTCDQPHISAALLRRLISLDNGTDQPQPSADLRVVRCSGSRDVEPFPMLISSTMRSALASFLDSGRRRATDFAAEYATEIVELDEDDSMLLANLNTPDDLQRPGAHR